MKVCRVSPGRNQKNDGCAALGFLVGFANPFPNLAPVWRVAEYITVSLGEFNISWMLQTPYTKTLPVGLADSYASMRLEVGSAYTFIFFVILVPLLTLMQKLPERLSKRRALKNK